MSNLSLIKEETPEKGIKRLIAELMSDARKQLEVFEDPNTNIHEARKDLKKARALLRLVRKEIGEKAYKPANGTYRDAGRLLSDVRDSWVLYETVIVLRNRFDSQLANDAFTPLAEQLKSRHTNRMRAFVEANTTTEVLAMLGSYEQTIEELPINANDFGAFSGGLNKVYKRGRKAANRARSKPTTRNLHDWRKRVKYLYYQLGYLRDLWPRELKAFKNSLGKLSDLLGNDHDLAVLEKTLVNEEHLLQDSHDMELLSGIISQEHLRLQDQLWPAATRVYKESPKQFVNRLEAYWDALQLEVG